MQSFWLGFVITALPGAVFFETIRRTLTDKSSVVKFLVGNFTGMVLIILAVFSGVVSIITGATTNIFYALSGGVLMYIGISSLIHPKHKKTIVKTRRTTHTAFITGFVLAVANPLSIIFWITQMGKFLNDSEDWSYAIFNSASVVAGALTLFILLTTVLHYTGRMVRKNYLTKLSYICSGLVVLYGSLAVSHIFI